MSSAAERPNWRQLWASGVLARFCFIGVGIIFHAGGEYMVSTIMPAMVRDIGGVELNGWNFAIYEVGAIVAGAAAGRLSTYWPLRLIIVGSALIYAIGSAATALAPVMEWSLAGRLLAGFGGGALISLSFIATQRFFPSAIWPQLMAILSVVWGVAAFGGPLFAGLVERATSWRWVFGSMAIVALLYAFASMVVLRREPHRPAGEGQPGTFPFGAIACLSAAIMAIGAAGVQDDMTRAGGFVVAGIAGLILFFVLDARNGSSRLFPPSPFALRRTVGSGLLMAAALSFSTCTFGYYGPLLLAALHDYDAVTMGLIIASESVAWSVLSILVANAPRHLEGLIVRGGAVMVAAGVAGFAYAIPNGSIPAILFFAMLQGGGFGILWPFASRSIIEASPMDEREITAAAFSNVQRIGYAVGSASAGIIANANGFSDGFTRESASTAVLPLFLYFLPVAILGCAAAFKLTTHAATRST